MSGAPSEAATRRCPTCDAVLGPDARHRPFCSARCKWVDLGKWFNEEYRVPGPDAVSFEGLETSSLDPREHPGPEHEASD